MIKLWRGLFRAVRSAAIAAGLLLTVPASPILGQTLQIPSNLLSEVYHWAPFLVRETLSSVVCSLTSLEVNQTVRVDFDGDVNATNNQGRATCGNTAGDDFTATVYFSAVETGTNSDNGYYFLGYYWYEPRDNGWWENSINNDPGHEHDMEGILLIVKKLPGAPYGDLANVLTQAHGALLPYGTHYTYAGTSTGVYPGNLGLVNYWTDYREVNHFRPTFISAAGTHATYVPDMCAAVNPTNAGIVDNSSTPGAYAACVRSGNDAIVYQPMLQGGAGPDQPAIGDQHGLFTYQLIELSQSVLWANKLNSALFGNGTLSLAGGVTASKFFLSNSDPGQANPPWAWNGDQKCSFGNCYNYFYQDGTNQSSSSRGWFITDYGTFLALPATEAGIRFSGLQDLSQPLRYDPYVASPPNYDGSTALSASVSGPQMIPSGSSQTWTAYVSGGTAPYTVQWSGILSGNGSSVSGTPSDSGSLFLDVWDASNNHVATSVYVTVCPDQQISC